MKSRRSSRQSKADPVKALEKMIRAHKADVAPYRLCYQVPHQVFLGETTDVVILFGPESHESPYLLP